MDDFPPISTEEWEEQIHRDLRGADYGETLLWHLPDGLTVRPYYRAEDTAVLAQSDHETVEVPVGWKLRQDIRTPDLEAAVRHACTAIDAGIDMLGIDLRIEHDRCKGVPLLKKDDFESFLKEIRHASVALHLAGGVFSPALLALYLDTNRGNGSPVSLQFDPVAESARTGRRLDHLLDLAADMLRTVAGERLPDVRVLTVGSAVYHDAGATPVLETALLLASLSETLVQMIERGVPASQVLDRLAIRTQIGSSYFMEIARLRALRIVVRRLIDVFVPDERAQLPPIHGETSARNQTLFDPHENLLRSTTEAASAVVGGCDIVAIRTFDEPAGRYDAFSYRMARNIQYILRFEGGFGHVADPAAGSYYVEMLTDSLGRRAWQLFQDIESEGGLFDALEKGFIHQRLDSIRAEQRQAFAERRTVLVGTNHFPDTNERRLHDLADEGISVDDPERQGESVLLRSFEDLRAQVAAGSRLIMPTSLLDGPSLADPLPRERISEPVEERRLRTERERWNVHILLIPFGEPAVRSARANFAANFLGCGGFTIESPIGFDDTDAVERAIRNRPPDIVVYCAPDEAYRDLIAIAHHQLNDLNDNMIRGVVAKPEVSGELDDRFFEFAIHSTANLIDVLDELHRLLGLIPTTSEEVGR